MKYFYYFTAYTLTLAFCDAVLNLSGVWMFFSGAMFCNIASASMITELSKNLTDE